MARLESESGPAQKMPHTTTRDLVVVVLEYGLRSRTGAASRSTRGDRQQRLARPALRSGQGPG